MSGTELDSDGTNSFHSEHPWEQVGHPLYLPPERRSKGNWPPERAFPVGPAEAIRWNNLPTNYSDLKGDWYRAYGPSESKEK